MSSNPIGTIGSSRFYKALRASLVVEDGFNVRTDLGEITDLANSIAAQGVKRPLKVQRHEGDSFVVRDGHRRLAAIDNAISRKLIDPAAFEIPIQIEDKSLTKTDLLVLMATENDSKPLLPYEEAVLYKRLRDEGNTIAQVCKLVFRGDVHVQQRLALLNAAPEVQEAVKDGTLAATLAQNIQAYSKDHKAQAELVAQAKSGKSGKAAVREKVDPDKKRAVALRMKVQEVQDDLDATKEKLAAALAKNEWTQAQVKDLVDAINPALWNVVKLIGAKTALAKIISAQTPDE